MGVLSELICNLHVSIDANTCDVMHFGFLVELQPLDFSRARSPAVIVLILSNDGPTSGTVEGRLDDNRGMKMFCSTLAYEKM